MALGVHSLLPASCWPLLMRCLDRQCGYRLASYVDFEMPGDSASVVAASSSFVALSLPALSLLQQTSTL